MRIIVFWGLSWDSLIFGKLSFVLPSSKPRAPPVDVNSQELASLRADLAALTVMGQVSSASFGNGNSKPKPCALKCPQITIILSTFFGASFFSPYLRKSSNPNARRPTNNKALDTGVAVKEARYRYHSKESL